MEDKIISNLKDLEGFIQYMNEEDVLDWLEKNPEKCENILEALKHLSDAMMHEKED